MNRYMWLCSNKTLFKKKYGCQGRVANFSPVWQNISLSRLVLKHGTVKRQIATILLSSFSCCWLIFLSDAEWVEPPGILVSFPLTQKLCMCSDGPFYPSLYLPSTKLMGLQSAPAPTFMCAIGLICLGLRLISICLPIFVLLVERTCAFKLIFFLLTQKSRE